MPGGCLWQWQLLTWLLALRTGVWVPLAALLRKPTSFLT
jgi:hypothetical protein